MTAVLSQITLISVGLFGHVQVKGTMCYGILKSHPQAILEASLGPADRLPINIPGNKRIYFSYDGQTIHYEVYLVKPSTEGSMHHEQLELIVEGYTERELRILPDRRFTRPETVNRHYLVLHGGISKNRFAL